MTECQNILQAMGLRCTSIKYRNGENEACLVQTPITYMDGEIIGFYIIDETTISDGGNFYFHFASLGFNLSDSRNFRGFNKILSKYGFVVNQGGEVLRQYNTNSFADTVEAFIRMACEISDWERDKLLEPKEKEHDLLVREVINYHRLWKPDTRIETKIQLRGASGLDYVADMQIDGLITNALKPNRRSASAMIHMAIDLINLPDPVRCMAVLDDRYQPKEAQRESTVMSGAHISVMKLSHLMDRASALH